MFSFHHTRRLLADLTVGTRLGMGFGALIALMLVLTLFGVHALQDNTRQLAQIGGISAAQLAEIQSQQQQWIVRLGSLGALALLGGAVVAWALVDSVKWPLDRAVDMAERLANGEDQPLVDAHRQDEFGHLLRAMADIRRRLQSATQDAAKGTAQAVPAPADPRIDERAPVAAVQMPVPVLADGDQPLQVSVRTAQEMLSVAVTAAQRGGEVVSQVVANMDDIRAASREIFETIGKIDNIAFQTNLLALHAAVEAAQAGEKGKGFAQVAGEVRALAVRAANAAKEIKALVHASVEKVEFGGQLARDADLTMDAIVVSVQRMTDLVEHRRQHPQLGGPQAAQPEQDVLLLDRLHASNATMVAESASTAEALRLQAERLQKVVNAFQMLQQTQEAAWNAHHAITSARQRAKGEPVSPMPPFPASDWGTLDEKRQRRRTDDRGDGSGGDSTTY